MQTVIQDRSSKRNLTFLGTKIYKMFSLKFVTFDCSAIKLYLFFSHKNAPQKFETIRELSCVMASDKPKDFLFVLNYRTFARSGPKCFKSTALSVTTFAVNSPAKRIAADGTRAADVL